MNRRAFLLALAAGAAASLTACTGDDPLAGPQASIPISASAPTTVPILPPPYDPATTLPAGSTTLPAGSSVTPAQPALTPPVPSGPVGRGFRPDRIISALPGSGDSIALTVDDGVNSEVVAAYIEFAKHSGARFTFFVTGVNDSWRANAPALRPLVESGQIQLGHHTWDHPDLRTLSDQGIHNQIRRNEQFIEATYGVNPRPFLRPPYGFYNDRTRRVAADCGYPVTTLWYGSLADSALLTEAQLLANARQWFAAQRIIIGHANYLPVTRVYDQLLEIVHERRLRLVTLDDVFATAADRAIG